jgi:organic hydroperoxide reductase OsmC/OhrA
VVDAYRDNPVGILDRNADGKKAMTRITLRPTIAFGGERQPSRAELDAIHHDAHEQCYIANSIKTDLVIEGVF